MYVSLEETAPIPYALGLLSTAALVFAYSIFVGAVILGTTILQLKVTGTVPNIPMLQGAGIACAMILGVFSHPYLVERWEATLIRWSWTHEL